jgi:hypothetical protein
MHERAQMKAIENAVEDVAEQDSLITTADSDREEMPTRVAHSLPRLRDIAIQATLLGPIFFTTGGPSWGGGGGC